MSAQDFDRAAGFFAIQQLLAEYCRELDETGGLNAHQFFAEDGVLDFGKMRIDGSERMKAFYADIVARGNQDDKGRTTRHIFNNLRISFEAEDRALVDCVMLNFSSVGQPPIMGGTVPTIVSDTHLECRRTSAGWRIDYFTGAPIFVGDDPLQNATLLE